MNTPTDLEQQVKSLTQRLGALERMSIELALAVQDQSPPDTQRRINHLLNELQYAGLDTTGQM